MSETKLLQVGDKIIRNTYNRLQSITIERTTKTQAISGHYRFRREYSGKSVTEVGKGISFGTHYEIETEELKEKLRHQKYFSFLKDYNWANLNVNEMNFICHTLKQWGKLKSK